MEENPSSQMLPILSQTECPWELMIKILETTGKNIFHYSNKEPVFYVPKYFGKDRIFKGWLEYFVGETHHQNFEDVVWTLSAAYLINEERNILNL